MIVTFYSFKGGVGRSMALVNAGEILAGWGYRVILCDWDLEAPGLERYLVDGHKGGGTSAEMAGWLAQPGLIDLLQEYKESMAKPPGLSEPDESPPEPPPTHQIVGKVALRRPSSRAVPSDSEKRRPGSLSLLTAGRRDGDHYNRYAEVVRSFDWDDFYEKWAGGAYMEFLRLDLAGDLRAGTPGAADIVLIDSRTGVTEQGGVCTHHLADLVVLLSAANDLNLDGALRMARTLAEDPRLVEARGGRPLQVLPVASRIEQTAQKEELVTFRHRFRQDFGRYIPAAAGRAEDFVLEAEIPYMPFYSFTERVVAREPEAQREQKLYAAYVALAEGIVRSGVASGLLPEANAQGRVARLPLPARSEPSARPKGLILLGYAAADRPLAEAVAQGLSAAGVQVWADFLPQPPGGPGQDGAPHAFEVCTAYVPLLGPGGIPPSLRAEIDYALNRQARQPELRIVPVLLPGADARSLGPLAGLYAVRATASLAASGAEATELFTSLAAELGAPGTEAPPALGEAGPPYPGLRAFDEAQARLFFGRAAEIRELVSRLGDARSGGVRWVQIEGPGGVGKSSFVFAGLVPAVRRGWIPGTSKSWLVASCRPGSDPIASLAAAFDRLDGVAPSERQARLAATERGLCDLVRAATTKDEGFLLVVDQFEELLAVSDAGARAQADALLAAALKDPDLPFYLVTALRSDALDRFQELPRLRALLDRGAVRHSLRPLSEDALREAMTAPARLAGLAFESGLAERILRDLRLGQPSPALLGMLLSRLWKNRSGNLLAHEAYDRLGGIDGVLAESAERCFLVLPEGDQALARELLLELVTAQGVRRSVPRDDLTGAAGDDPRTGEVLSRLAAAQIVAFTDDRVELAHDALVLWPRLAAWMAAERGTLKRREELESAALAWTNAGAPADGLPGGPQLAYFEPAPATSKPAVRYLTVARQREKRRKLIIWCIAVTTLTLGLIGSGLAFWDQTRKERSQGIAQTAQASLRAEPTASLHLAVEAANVADTPLTKSVLKEAIRSARVRIVLYHSGKLNLVLFSPDGERVLTAGAGGAILWQVEPAGRARQIATDETLTDAAFTPDGSQLRTLTEDGRAAQWDLRSGARLETGYAPIPGTHPKPGLPKDMPSFPSLLAWARGEEKNSPASSDGAWSASRDGRGAIRLWHFGKRAVDFERAGPVRLVECSPKGGLLVTVQGDALSPIVWDLWTGAPRAVLHGHEGVVSSAVFSPDGHSLATTSGDGTARLWDVTTGKEIAVLRGHTGAVTGAAFSPDGRRLVTAGADNTARVWDLGEPLEIRDDNLEVLIQQAKARFPTTLGADGKPVAAVSVPY